MKRPAVQAAVAAVACIVGTQNLGVTESFHGHNIGRMPSFLQQEYKASFLGSQFRQQDVDAQQQQKQQQPHHHHQFPIPAMPSDNFRKMAQSQLELLANSLTISSDDSSAGSSSSSNTKVQSMILYLPQENSYSGQLEFTPAVLYPDPSTERVFIASDAASGQAPTLPKSLSKLPGFSSAPELLPGYPMLKENTQDDSDPDGNDDDTGLAGCVGVVEEVLCDIRFRTAALSVPLLSGSQTVGVLLVSPTARETNQGSNSNSTWTKRDKRQVSLAAQSLSMALNMDNERNILSEQNHLFRENLSDSLHQMKNPIQALRTYGKILQRQIIDNNYGTNDTNDGGSAKLLELAERLMVQSDRVVDMLGPMDSLVETLDLSPLSMQYQLYTELSPVMLPPAQQQEQQKSLVLYKNNDSQLSGSSSSPKDVILNTTINESSDVNNNNNNKMIGNGSSSSHHRPPLTSNTERHAVPLLATVIGDFETEMVFITDVLEPVFDTFEAIASEQGIDFEVCIDDVDDLPGVFVAPKSFQEAVSNVLDNALKYAVLSRDGSALAKNPSPRVRVRIFPNDECCCCQRGSSGGFGSRLATTTTTPGVTILVEDNGPGVAEDDQHLIFQRGFRSEKTASVVEGQGIGLDISRALLERMGGCLGLVCRDEKESYYTNYPEWFSSDDDDDDDEIKECLDGATIKLEVSRKPYKSPGK